MTQARKTGPMKALRGLVDDAERKPRKPRKPTRRPAVLVGHPVFETPGFGAHHPLSINRQAGLGALIDAMGWRDPVSSREAPLAERATLERFHAAHYVAAVERSARVGRAEPGDRAAYNLGSMECPVFPGLWERARASVGGAILAAELALAGQLPFHPGGGTHHGRPDRASGFCYFNDPVFAILHLLDAGLARVAYADLDAHHGDGVEAAFADEPRVRLLSIHETGRWPGTGALSDTCSGRAINLPVPRGLASAGFARLRDEVIAPAMAAWTPEAAVVTLGADALAGDPLSGLQLLNEDLWQAVDLICETVPVTVILGGGGYNPWTTTRLWAGQWARMSGRETPRVLPDAARAVLDGMTCDLVEEEDAAPHWRTSITDAGSVPPFVEDEETLAEVERLIAAVAVRQLF